MGKMIFILDRPDFINMRKVLEDQPGIAQIDAAEVRLREARDAFLAHNTKIRSDTKATLEAMAMRLNDPRKLEAPAREYHRALVAWCQLTAKAFAEVHDDQVDIIDDNSRNAGFPRLVNEANNHPKSEARAAALAKINELARKNAPHVQIRDIAQRGRSAVFTAFHFATGTPIQGANEDRFAQANDPLKKVA